MPTPLRMTSPEKRGRGPHSRPPDPYIGTLLNSRFLVEAKLGEGGFGAVYRGVQEGTGRQVALKVLHPRMTRSPQIVERFKREGRVLCKLRDAHTVTTYDFDTTEDGTLFIAMELLVGQSLQTVFTKEAPISWRRMFKIVADICSSLSEAHPLGIVHRDLKPENIYLEQRGEDPDYVKVLDFGIAKLVSGEIGGAPAQLTATGQTLGTLEYMSPEQLMGRQLDGRSDIYALGVVTFELITGRLPFPDAVGPAALISAQIRSNPPVPSSLNPTVPPEADAVILRMLAKTPNERYGDVMELRRACVMTLHQYNDGGLFDVMPEATPRPMARGWFADAPKTIPTPPPGFMLPEPPASIASALEGTVEPPKRRVPMWLIALLFAGLGGVAAFFAWQWLQ